METKTTDTILFTEHNGLGVITLNRPQALNALTHEMIRLLDAQLVHWAQDPSIVAVMIESGSGKAFCAGGDIKSVAMAEPSIAVELFRDEYTLNYRIFTFPKPYIALIDGIVMGGGVGVSAHGHYRVVTEKVLFAMPEATIGFFPDVGMGHALARYPDEVGTYLGLTAKRLGLADCMFTGFATHFVPSARLPVLRERILAAPQELAALLEDFAVEVTEPGEVEALREEIATCFCFDAVEDIIAALEKHNTEWSRQVLATLQKLCPFSLKLTLQQLRYSVEMDFHDVMVMEYRLGRACIQRPDFREGVRALLIDRDNAPVWQPARLQDVSSEELAECFAPLGERDLVLSG